ncbi:hypothetical protein L6255_00670 [Candidatus Parcubacteria bacterium]|nr:hypothetical protein [Patescibacteria group bacterium]MBU4380884.1 hypothetical protein [Patescibacteria group bacterium]MCG2688935.1 hypothetical protein [Candidatus Parcubacteria bacterium]
MTTTIEKLPAKTYKLTITIPKDVVSQAFQKALTTLTSQVKIDGFRPGTAPADLVKDKIDPSKLRGEVVNTLLPQAVSSAIKEHHMAPIINPRINLKQLEDGKEATFEATIVELPEIVLGDYKKAVSDIQSFNAPRPLTPERSDGGQAKTPTKTADITNALLATSKVDISPTLIEEETTRMFSQLIDQTAKLGMTVEDYLRSIKKNLEELKAEYKKQAEENLKLEFILTEIAKVEKIAVSDEEIQSAINANPDSKAREELAKEENKWYIRAILLKNKVLIELSKGI